MSEEEGLSSLRDPQVRRSLVRMWLRMLPLFPGPEMYDLLRAVTGSREELEDKVNRTTDALHEAAALVADLEQDLERRTARVEELQKEAQRLATLAEVEEEKARALIEQLRDTVQEGRRRERAIAVLLNIVAGLIVFVLGVIMGPSIRQWLGLGGS